MKKWFWRIFWAVLILAAFAGVGFAGYRVGYQRGAQSAGDGPAVFFQRFADDREFNPDRMPLFHEEFGKHDFAPGFGPGRFQSVMVRSHGIGLFSPLRSLIHLTLLGLVIWIGYNLFKGNGWQLTLTRNPVNTTEEAPQQPEAKPTKRKSTKANG